MKIGLYRIDMELGNGYVIGNGIMVLGFKNGVLIMMGNCLKVEDVNNGG